MNPPWASATPDNVGLTMEDFKQIEIPKTIMPDGIIFVWTEKHLIHEMVKYFETQGFQYVENMCWVMLDKSKKEEVERSESIDVVPAFYRKESEFFQRSKCTLLIFRRIIKGNIKKLELRH